LNPFTESIFNIKSFRDFESLALAVFRFQYEENPVYREYVNLLNVDIDWVRSVADIPFLPVSFFKNRKIITGETDTSFYFQSSGTTGQVRSKHFVVDKQIYINSFTASFRKFYGNFKDYCFLALLPLYLEQQHSSLVFMIDYFIKNSLCAESAFFLNDFERLADTLRRLEKAGKKTILIGISYALMDFAEFYNESLNHTIVMETGAMKGNREELTKKELHRFLKDRFLTEIYSEYGMTELFSQAYSKEGGKFFAPPWMKILIRDRYDPFSYLPVNKIGGINIIDLANINSCSFIETQDLGKINFDGSFELQGRFDVADIRGCNLLVEQ